jgi:hypothetical protein
MSESNRRSKVAAKLNELAKALEVDIEDVQVTIEDGGFSNTVIDGVEVAEYLTEGEEEQTPTESENATEGGDEAEIHFEEMDYKHLQKLASEELAEYPEDSSRDGLIEAMKGNVGIEDSEFHQTPTESDNTTEGSDTEAEVSEADLLEAGVKPKNIEDVLEYRSKNGVCSVEDCPYGASSEESDHCASHRGSSSNSESSESPKENRELSELSEAEKSLVSTLIEDEGKGLEEAISMV